MLRNITQDKKWVDLEIEQSIGKAYGWMQKLLDGNKARKVSIIDASSELQDVIDPAREGLLEIRPGGLMISFRHSEHQYAFVIPYHKLSLFKSSNSVAFHGDGGFLRVSDKRSLNKRFLKKILERKAANLQMTGASYYG